MDGCVASLDMLPEIAAAVKGKIDIIFDSGVRTGSDVVRSFLCHRPARQD
jgi:lactate 2-monooxygenase